MIINIYGTSSKKLKRKLESAARFYAKILIHPRTIPTLNLDIEILPSLDVIGQCINEDDTKRSRYFTIQLRKANLEEELEVPLERTLAHEMVHVKQYVKNELSSGILSINRRGVAKLAASWNGQLWSPKRHECSYFDSPWEIEALGREESLYYRWLESEEQSSNIFREEKSLKVWHKVV